ncbi:hypothetical protein ACIPSE_05805 [Streptomyces sp. NPDC090106]|uniref:hypothetical protein n=1 Tax=Streptomyces sp. NPDC090106 TaxID=3365946 RepID=UPI003811C956
MDEQNDDDHLFCSRDRSAFMLEVKVAAAKGEVASVIEWFGTTKKYVLDNFPELAEEVIDLPIDPDHPSE